MSPYVTRQTVDLSSPLSATDRARSTIDQYQIGGNLMDLSPLYNPDAPKHARLICCDWQEEHGDDEQRPTAMAWRWVINEGKRPNPSFADDDLPYSQTWDWLDEAIAFDELPESGIENLVVKLPSTSLNFQASGDCWFREYRTREDAYNALITALVEAEREGQAPWQQESTRP